VTLESSDKSKCTSKKSLKIVNSIFEMLGQTKQASPMALRIQWCHHLRLCNILKMDIPNNTFHLDSASRQDRAEAGMATSNTCRNRNNSTVPNHVD
jgi:uncharacterized protein YwlG (UPF0340 family)